jgi:ribosome-binding protein aMBF1 (putative translation factor)
MVMPVASAAQAKRQQPESRPQAEVLAEEIRFHRKQLGLSLEALAELSGVSKSMISKVERAEAVPSTKHRLQPVRILSGDRFLRTSLLTCRSGVPFGAQPAR